MVDSAQLTNSQLLAEWERESPAALVNNEQLSVEWEPTPAVHLTNAQLLVEWMPEERAITWNEQASVDWEPAPSVRLESAQLLIEWVSASYIEGLVAMESHGSMAAAGDATIASDMTAESHGSMVGTGARLRAGTMVAASHSTMHAGGRVTYAPRGLLIHATDPVTGRTVVIPRTARKKLVYGSRVNGGDANASWTMDCDVFASVGYPAWQSIVKIINTDTSKVVWNGVLEVPRARWERGRLVSISYAAVGMPDATHRQFPEATVMGDVNYPATVADRIEVSDLRDAMVYGITIAPLVVGTQSHIATTGITLAGDTEDFRGNSVVSLWSGICALTAIMGTPSIWMVQPDESGAPALYFLSAPASPEYFEEGQSKSNELEISAADIANLVYVALKGNQTITVPDQSTDPPGALDYTNTPFVQTSYVNISEEVNYLQDAQGFAGGLYNKRNTRTPGDGTIVLDRPIRTLYAGDSTPQMVPIEEVRAGKVIQLRVTRTPYLHDVLVNVLIMACTYDEDACETTVSPTAIDKLGREARMISLLAGRNGFMWSLASGALQGPARDMSKTYHIEPTDVGYYGRYFDPDAVPVPSVYPEGWSQNIGTGTIQGSSVPPAPGSIVGTGAPPQMALAIVPVAQTAEGMPGFGNLGGKVLPQALPDERVNYPAIISTLDRDGEVEDYIHGGQDVQECFIDTITIKVIGEEDEVGTVTITVDVFNWDTEVTTPAVFEISLDEENHARFHWDGSTPALKPIYLSHQDHIIWKVSGAGGTFDVDVALDGWKAWSSFPVLIGPSWVPNG